MSSSKSKKCEICGKVLSEIRNLNRHIRSVHRKEPAIRQQQLNCAFDVKCLFKCSSHELLRKHLHTEHNFTVEYERKSFSSESDYEKWKRDLENEFYMCYVSATGKKTKGEATIHYLRCHKSGQARSITNNRKRKLKTGGYIQSGYTCPSVMQVERDSSGMINVLFYKTHLGHTCDKESLKLMRLGPKETAIIAAKLTEGGTVSQTLRSLKLKHPMTPKLQKINTQDIYNVKSRINYLKKELESDTEVIENWLKSIKLDPEDNLIMSYERSVDSKKFTLVFLLPLQKMSLQLLASRCAVYICTLNTSQKEDYKIVLVYVCNAKGDGFPLSVMYCSNISSETVAMLFSFIAETIGAVSVNVFVSSNTSLYYECWQNYFGEVDHVLLCNIDLLCNWLDYLEAIHENLYENLKLKLENLLIINNELEFQVQLMDILNILSSESDCKVFFNHFTKNYLNQCESWANYNKMRIDKIVKPIRKVFENEYVKSIELETVCVTDILFLSREMCYNFLFKFSEHFKNELLTQILVNHQSASYILEQDKKCVIEFVNEEWCFTEESCIVKLNQSCTQTCVLTCDVCGICVHSYTCTCSNYLLHWTICKHIHSVCLTLADIDKDEEVEDRMSSYESSNMALKNTAISAVSSLLTKIEDTPLSDESYVELIMNVNDLIKKFQ